MKVTSITSKADGNAVKCIVKDGYLQGAVGSLPDVDTDYESEYKQDIKAYTERRYNHNGKQRVFSAGAFTTLKMKAVIKDIARTMHIPVSTVNYMTAILPSGLGYTDLFKFAYENKKIYRFIQDYPQLFETIRTLLDQPRASSIHPSALLITPDVVDGEDVECFDVTPIKKIDGLLVSEFDGYQLDACGLLKNDCLATKELSKLKQVMALCNSKYGTCYSLDSILRKDCNDPKVFELIRKGHTQDVFQLSSEGMTKFLKEMKPDCIEDLIAANALYRPATLSSGSTQAYVDCKLGFHSPVYKWGTYNALNKTFGQIVYQEQVAQIVREVADFSLGEGVNLVKFISKKKVDKIKAMKEKFMANSLKKGCPQEDADAIWDNIELCGSYIFNRSHATAYGLTAYAGGYLKVHHPTAFYTVSLEWANDKELPLLMGEMADNCGTRIVFPEINKSETKFFTDFDTDEIYWSLTKIKNVGLAASSYIVEERKRKGDYTGIENFIERIFRYKLKVYKYWDDPDNALEAEKCPVNARHVRCLILAGCFDKVEGVKSVTERYGILMKAAAKLGFELKENEFPKEQLDKHYFWSQQQIAVSGLGSVDYKRIFDSSRLKHEVYGWPFRLIEEAQGGELDGHKATICATVADIEEKNFVSSKTGKTEKFVKLTLQQNKEITTCIGWPEQYEQLEDKIKDSKGKIIILNTLIKYSTFSGKNEFVMARTTKIEII